MVDSFRSQNECRTDSHCWARWSKLVSSEMVLEFSDVSVEGADVVSFDSKENEQKYVRDCLIQTEPRVFASRSTQVIRRKEIPVR